MKIHTLPSGDEVHRFDYNIVIPFQGKRRVLSTSPYNGGYRTDLTTVFNHDGNPGVGCPSTMKAKTFREHMMKTIQEIGLDLDTTTGMETAAHMENVAIHTETYEELAVTAIVTGGIEVNGGRVGDPAAWIEKGDVPQEYRLGTINIFLCINADLAEGAMARALVTCTEAKTTAVQELLAESHYSRGLATGSGTDSTIVVANMESPLYLTNGGKHSKLGELIGRAVKPAVKQALFLQTGLGPRQQHNAVRRLSRFGVSEAGIFFRYQNLEKEGEKNTIRRPVFSDFLERIERRSDIVTNASFLAHAMDQMDWGMLEVKETVEAASRILCSMGMENDLVAEEIHTADEAVTAIVDGFEKTMVKAVLTAFEEKYGTH